MDVAVWGNLKWQAEEDLSQALKIVYINIPSHAMQLY